MKTINRDITTVEQGIIGHCCNCQGAMNSGVAKALRNKYPKIFEEYTKHISASKFAGNWCWSPENLLGNVNLVNIKTNLYIANIFAQEKYGYDKKRYLSYAALDKALESLVEKRPPEAPVYFPFLFGSDRAGGNWEIVSLLIQEYFPDAIFCKFP